MILFSKNFSFMLFIVIHTMNIAYGQVEEFKYSRVNQESLKRFNRESNSYAIPAGAFLARKVIRKNATVSMNTQNLQEAIDSYDEVVLPNYPIVIAKEGIRLKDNSTLVFQKNSKLLIEPNSLDYYQLIKIHDVSNVTIIDAKLVGDRDKHLSKTGEWGYGISIRNSENILVKNFKIEKFWGDGIAIGYGSTGTSKNIKLENGFLDHNRRNGLSVMNVNGLEVRNLYVSNTHGAKPMFGIDFEPNNANDELNNITLENIYSYNNANGGLMITFSKLKSKVDKEIGFRIRNFADKGSLHGIMLAGVPKGAEGLFGNIVLEGILLDENKQPLTGRTINNERINVDIQDLKIQNPKNKNIHHNEVKRVFDLKKNYSIKFAE